MLIAICSYKICFIIKFPKLSLQLQHLFCVSNFIYGNLGSVNPLGVYECVLLGP